MSKGAGGPSATALQCTMFTRGPGGDWATTSATGLRGGAHRTTGLWDVPRGRPQQWADPHVAFGRQGGLLRKEGGGTSPRRVETTEPGGAFPLQPLHPLLVEQEGRQAGGAAVGWQPSKRHKGWWWVCGTFTALVWTEAWLGPIHPTIDHRSVVGVKTGTGFCLWNTRGFGQLDGREGGCRSG